MYETSAQGWCTGKTQRNGIGREVGGRFRMGNTCKSMADSFQCMTKTITILESNYLSTNKNKFKKKACSIGIKIILTLPLRKHLK